MRLCNVRLAFAGNLVSDGNGVDAAEAVNALAPVAVESRVGHALRARCVVEASVIGDDADVLQVVEEDERAEAPGFHSAHRRKACPQRARV